MNPITYDDYITSLACNMPSIKNKMDQIVREIYAGTLQRGIILLAGSGNSGKTTFINFIKKISNVVIHSSELQLHRTLDDHIKGLLRDRLLNKCIFMIEISASSVIPNIIKRYPNNFIIDFPNRFGNNMFFMDMNSNPIIESFKATVANTKPKDVMEEINKLNDKIDTMNEKFEMIIQYMNLIMEGKSNNNYLSGYLKK